MRSAVRSRTPLVIILAVVGVVLLIASVNVANLLLARGAARLPELATRAALGAGRWRLVRQLATEGLLLAVLGGLLGVGLAWMTIPILASQISLGYTTMLIDAHPDARVLGLALALTATAALVAGVLPALRLSRTTLQSGLASGSRTTIASGQRLQRALVTAQLAMSLLLVSAAGLLLRTIVHLAGVDPGFTPAHVVMLNVRDEAPQPSFGGVDDAARKAQRAERYRVLDERLNAVPGVRAASVSWLGLFSMQDLWLPLIDPDRSGRPADGTRRLRVGALLRHHGHAGPAGPWLRATAIARGRRASPSSTRRSHASGSAREIHSAAASRSTIKANSSVPSPWSASCVIPSTTISETAAPIR